MYRCFAFMMLSLLMSSTSLLAQQSVVAEGAKPKRIVDDCQFTEGPAVNALGEVFFTDQPNDRIIKVDLAGKIETFLQPAGRSNGLFFAPDGKLIACADEKNELWEIDSDGSHKVLLKDYSGKKLNGPNDVWIHPDGWMYFTDPFYKRPWWTHNQMPQDGSFVYRVMRDGTKLQRIGGNFKQPNGIVGDAARGLLFVADIGDRKTYRYEITKEGDLVNRQLFCDLGSDGMTLDEQGNLYLTGKEGVTVVDPNGKVLEVITIAEPWTANVCFGSKDRKTLYVTASKTLYTVEMRVSGL